MIYTGIGSRKTPPHILKIMVKIGRILARKNYTLRSGGAEGADSAFEQGCALEKGKKEIFLPWKNFNKNNSNLYSPSNEAFVLAEKFHPAWSRCSNGAKLLHARNCHQILGLHLDLPTSFVVCWTTQSGGTQQALRIAKHYNIKIYNLIDKTQKDELWNFLRCL
jgi:hypothetical protein